MAAIVFFFSQSHCGGVGEPHVALRPHDGDVGVKLGVSCDPGAAVERVLFQSSRSEKHTLKSNV